MTNEITIAKLRLLTFNNGKEDLTVAKRNGSTIWLRNAGASMRTENQRNLFNPAYYTIVTK